jgi:hypothetical protein
LFAIDVVYTGGKFATGINNASKTGGKFAAGFVDTGGAPLVSTTQRQTVANGKKEYKFKI